MYPLWNGDVPIFNRIGWARTRGIVRKDYKLGELQSAQVLEQGHHFFALFPDNCRQYEKLHNIYCDVE